LKQLNYLGGIDDDIFSSLTIVR